eukprot:5299187-Lingulodinium_polyedra.AAC.1
MQRRARPGCFWIPVAGTRGAFARGARRTSWRTRKPGRVWGFVARSGAGPRPLGHRSGRPQ